MRKQSTYCMVVGLLLAACGSADMAAYCLDCGYLPYEYENPTGEFYNRIGDNDWVEASEQASSTFAIDADGASLANVRRFLQDGTMPPVDAVRIEELLNYFTMEIAAPDADAPIRVVSELFQAPWNTEHRLLRIGMRGRALDADRPASNIVLLLDVSGSMSHRDKLPLLQQVLQLYVPTMLDKDRISIVTYAGDNTVLLEGVAGSEQAAILAAIASLESGGSTAGAGGIHTAYRIAEDYFAHGGNNRIILATDGDFNVGVSDQQQLLKLIEEKRASGVMLTVLGFGTGNLNEGMLEQLANHGNGNFEYIDSLAEGRKVFVHNFGKLFTVVQDLKIQVGLHAAAVDQYRLLGYSNRTLDNSDFGNDATDAGELGAGQTITALYELKPVTDAPSAISAAEIRWRGKAMPGEVLFADAVSQTNAASAFTAATEDSRFAAAVAAWGMRLRQNYAGMTSTHSQIYDWVDGARSYDPFGYRAALLELIQLAEELDR